MTFDEWFNSAPHRKKYTTDHPVYLAALEAWGAAHEACAKVADDMTLPDWTNEQIAAAIRARGKE